MTGRRTRRLTQAQEGLWFAQRLDPDNPILNTGQIVTLRGPLDRTAFKAAVEQALREAPALAVRFIDGPDGPEQILDDPAFACLDIIDLSAATDPLQAALDHIDRDMARPRDPLHDLLVTEELLIAGPDLHVWNQNIHHLVIDGYGTSLLNRRIAALYNETVTAVPDPDTAFASFDDLLAEDAAYQGSERETKERAYWNELFADRPQVIGIAPGEATSVHSFHRYTIDIGPEVTKAITTRARAAELAWPDLVTTIAGAFVARHTGTADTVVGVPHMGRLGSVAARVPAMVMNVLPLRMHIDEDVPLEELASSVARQLIRGRRHGRYRSEQLRRDLGLIGGERRLYGPLINIMPFDMPFRLHGIDSDLRVPGAGAVDDITFTLRADAAGETMRLELDTNPTLYTAERTRQLGHRFVAFLHAASTHEKLANTPTLSPEELHRWQTVQTSSTHPVEDTTLADLLARRAMAQPDALALIDGDRRWTYAELERETAHFASKLRLAGVKKGDVVVVALPRSWNLVVALLATVRMGAAYLPLDLTHPPDRIKRILDSAKAAAKPSVIVTTAEAKTIFPDDAPLLFVGQGNDVLRDADVAFETPAPEDAAYIIYTSGSTGMPKGVVIEHRAIVNRLLWMGTHYGIGPGDRILQKTPATFDVSVWEFFLPFITGATLVVAPPDAHKDPHALAALVREHGITTMHFVPSMLALFLDEPQTHGLAIHRVFVSGEELPADLRDRFHAFIDGELHNLYGPTEAAVDVSYWLAAPTDISRPVPIGHPVWNTRLYVLDARFRPLPSDVVGELFLAGRQLARGYLGQPDLTDERFIPDPFFAGEKMYRTGDLARVRDDEAVVFLGRTDHQVKLRGLRIELGEIEAAIVADPAVAQAVVDARDDGAGGKRLVGYLVAAPGSPIDSEALRVSVASRVPDYMVPSAFVTLDRLPLSANGKLDRKALPDPSFTSVAGRAPSTDTERRLVALFAECLHLDAATISADDDFFELGGHSLLAAKLLKRIRDQWGSALADDASGDAGRAGVVLGLGVIFTDSTVARLAARIDAALAAVGPFSVTDSEGLAQLIRLNRGDTASSLFCIHPAGGISWCYAGLARALAPEHAVFGVQARGLDADAAPPESIDAIAADYIGLIRAVQPQGPVHLAGWSVGGIIAHAMAVQLSQAGEPPGLLAMLDSYPSDSWREQTDPSEDVALKALVQIAGRDVSELGDVELTRERVMRFLRDIGNPLGMLSDAALNGVLNVVAANNRLVRQHRHGLFPGKAVYFRAALDHIGTDLSPDLWAPYIKQLEVHEVSSLHAHLTGAVATSYVAPVIAQALRQHRLTGSEN
ncbi:non-ribosomal peptide synthetase [Pseudochelatococcus contaminans]|uniref:Enterobactin synthetase component F n=1 Tax=Pseudochelatococcus contaminans TaxID=1538103 RepID=A0A7W5Z1D9_9HYPH|nr:non-ribosomal peptide synthetase [Pseudochelatococcus contaminans]MBB3808080.1 enterobactin synthetase component F [Pseudochelatococcus contaminans]